MLFCSFFCFYLWINCLLLGWFHALHFVLHQRNIQTRPCEMGVILQMLIMQSYNTQKYARQQYTETHTHTRYLYASHKWTNEAFHWCLIRSQSIRLRSQQDTNTRTHNIGSRSLQVISLFIIHIKKNVLSMCSRTITVVIVCVQSFSLLLILIAVQRERTRARICFVVLVVVVLFVYFRKSTYVYVHRNISLSK